MPSPKFFVVARVVGRDGAIALWKDRLVNLCAVSAKEPYGDSYYWGADIDGEPDTLWGLEGYTHPYGFFVDHVSSDIFKHEMALVDKDKLLRNVQGLGSPDYDLHHYDKVAGYLRRDQDDSTTSHVAIYHFWTNTTDQRGEVLNHLSSFAETSVKGGPLQSALVLKECGNTNMATLWLRVESSQAWATMEASDDLVALLSQIGKLCSKTELHQSQSFIGHLDQSH